jgi:hypothetical protein
MSNVLQFPSKNKFKAQFKDKIPDDILNDMLSAYDRVLVLKDEYPTAWLRVIPGDEDDAKRLADGLQNYVLKLLQRILELEAELCLIKRNP